MDLDFPLWIRLTHFFNILFLSLLVRSGIEILGAHPMLYWNDDCTPGSEWVRFTRKRMPRGELWTAEDEKQPYTPVVALPGRDNLGLGRYWHFVGIVGWIVVGVVYVVALFVTPQWHRLVPTSWDVFPDAYDALLAYVRLEPPPTGDPFNALQQLTYFGVIFVLSPLQIATGIAMSPAMAARFPWFTRLFGGRQSARSLHFLGMIAFIGFTIHHIALVFGHGFVDGMAAIILGVTDEPTSSESAVAVALAILGLGVIVAVHIWATRSSLLHPRRMQNRLQRLVDPLQRRLLQPLRSRQAYPGEQITVTPRPNGRPPRDPRYQALARDDFRDFRFEVGGLVANPLQLSLDDLRALAGDAQVTKHVCIQGWSQVVAWRGVALSRLLDRCGPLPEARYLLFHTFDDKWDHDDGQRGYYYTTVDLELARRPQSILAYDMNGGPLPIEFGAPLRLRLENQLGYKMVKWVRAVELIDDYRTIGEGKGGWREDVLNYSQIAPI